MANFWRRFLFWRPFWRNVSSDVKKSFFWNPGYAHIGLRHSRLCILWWQQFVVHSGDRDAALQKKNFFDVSVKSDFSWRDTSKWCPNRLSVKIYPGMSFLIKKICPKFLLGWGWQNPKKYQWIFEIFANEKMHLFTYITFWITHHAPMDSWADSVVMNEIAILLTIIGGNSRCHHHRSADVLILMMSSAILIILISNDVVVLILDTEWKLLFESIPVVGAVIGNKFLFYTVYII